MGFRYYTRDIARSLGLTGWVRNRPDGSMELEAQGEAPDLELLCRQLKEGPSMSHVSNVIIKDIPVVKETEETVFSIRY